MTAELFVASEGEFIYIAEGEPAEAYRIPREPDLLDRSQGSGL